MNSLKLAKDILELTSFSDALSIISDYTSGLNDKYFFELTFANAFGVIRFGVTRGFVHLNIFDVV